MSRRKTKNLTWLWIGLGLLSVGVSALFLIKDNGVTLAKAWYEKAKTMFKKK